MKPRTLVAGMGDVSSGDGGFGAAVVNQLVAAETPKWVRCADYGTGGMPLALDLLDGYETVIVVDVVRCGAVPGTTHVEELSTTMPAGDATAPDRVQGPGTHADIVFDLLGLLGGSAGRVLVVGCEPTAMGGGPGLSDAVARAVPEVARTIRELVEEDEQRIVQRAISLEV